MADFDLSTAKPVDGGFDLASAQPITLDPRSARITDTSDQYPLTAAVDVAINKSIVDLPGIPGGLWNMSHQLIKNILSKASSDDEAAGKVVDMLYGPEVKYTPQYLEQKARAAGIPIDVKDPNSAAQRYIAAASSGLIGGVPGIVANVANQGAQDLNLPPDVQAGVGLAASFLPGGLKRGVQSLLGINPETAAQNMETVAAVGVKPDLGLAAGPNTAAQTLTKLVAATPGGAAIIARHIDEANAAAAQTMEDVASNLTPGNTGQFGIPKGPAASGGGVSDTAAGLSLQQELGGEVPGGTNYLQKIRGRVDAAYQARDAAVPAGTQVDISGFLKRVEELEKTDPEFEQYIKTDPVFTRIRQNLDDAAKGGTQVHALPGGKFAVQKDGKWVLSDTPPAAPSNMIPYADAVIAQRSLSGLTDKGYMFGSTTPTLNGSLVQASKAMRGDVSAALEGIPGAKALDTRANQIWQEGELAKEKLKPILNSVTGADAMGALLSGKQRGGEIVNNAMRGLSVDQQNLVAGSVIQKLGQAVPSAQGAAGGEWSANTFLTNWNKLHDDAKTALFRNMPPEYTEQLSQFARYSELVKKSAELYSNPSGTANKMAMLGFTLHAASGLGAAGALALHHPAAAAATAASAIAPFVLAAGSAKLMTNPGVVRWLAASTKMPVSSLPIVASQLAKLGDPEATALAQNLLRQSQSTQQ